MLGELLTPSAHSYLAPSGSTLRGPQGSVGHLKGCRVSVQNRCLQGQGVWWVSSGDDVSSKYYNPGLKGMSQRLCKGTLSLCILSLSLGCMSCHFLSSAWQNSLSSRLRTKTLKGYLLFETFLNLRRTQLLCFHCTVSHCHYRSYLFNYDSLTKKRQTQLY